MSLVANPINFASISVSGPLQIVILIYWPCVQKNGGSNYIWLPSPLRWRRRYLFFGGLAKCVRRRTPLRETTVSRSQVPPASRDNRLICIQEVRWTKGLVLLGVLVRWDGFSKKTMEKQSQRRVKWWLLRPCFCDLTPHCFVICDRRDRGVDSVLYTVLHASKHGRKRRDVAFFYSFNQSIRELRFHLFGFGNTVHNGSHDAKSYFHIWLHIVDALNRTTWFCSCVLSIQISIILI